MNYLNYETSTFIHNDQSGFQSLKGLQRRKKKKVKETSNRQNIIVYGTNKLLYQIYHNEVLIRNFISNPSITFWSRFQSFMDLLRRKKISGRDKQQAKYHGTLFLFNAPLSILFWSQLTSHGICFAQHLCI